MHPDAGIWSALGQWRRGGIHLTCSCVTSWSSTEESAIATATTQDCKSDELSALCCLRRFVIHTGERIFRRRRWRLYPGHQYHLVLPQHSNQAGQGPFPGSMSARCPRMHGVSPSRSRSRSSPCAESCYCYSLTRMYQSHQLLSFCGIGPEQTARDTDQA